MTLSQKIFAIVFLILGVFAVGIGIFIIVRVSQDTPKELAIDRPPAIIRPSPTQSVRFSPTPESQDVLSSFEGEFINVSTLIREYNFSVKSSSTTNPLPDLILRIETISPVSDDANFVEVTPIIDPVYNNANQTWNYKFVWEGLTQQSLVLSSASVNMILKSSKFGVIQAPQTCINNCNNFISVSDDVPNSSIFTLTKSSVVTCTQNGDANISFKIRVRNIGTQSGNFTLLEDKLDDRFLGTPIAISPSGNFQNKKISWQGQNFNISSNQFIEFTYSLTINNTDLFLYQNNGFLNTAQLTFGNSNSIRFNLRTNVNLCGLNITSTPTPTPTITSQPTQINITPTISVVVTPTPIITRIPTTSFNFNNEAYKNIIVGFLFIISGILLNYFGFRSIYLGMLKVTKNVLFYPKKIRKNLFEENVSKFIKSKNNKQNV